MGSDEQSGKCPRALGAQRDDQNHLLEAVAAHEPALSIRRRETVPCSTGSDATIWEMHFASLNFAGRHVSIERGAGKAYQRALEERTRERSPALGGHPTTLASHSSPVAASARDYIATAIAAFRKRWRSEGARTQQAGAIQTVACAARSNCSANGANACQTGAVDWRLGPESNRRRRLCRPLRITTLLPSRQEWVGVVEPLLPAGAAGTLLAF